MLRIAGVVLAAVCLVVCAVVYASHSSALPVGTPVQLDTIKMKTGCFLGAEPVGGTGLLVPDPVAGTRVEGYGPVRWPEGFAGVRLSDGQVAVLDGVGVVAITGRRYSWHVVPDSLSFDDGSIFINCFLREVPAQAT